MVAALDLEADLVQLQHHLVAQVGEVVDRRDGEVTSLVPGLVPQVAALFDAARVPGRLDRIDVVVAGVLLRLETHVVEDVELGLGAEERRVGDPRRLQVRLGLRRDVARVARVLLARERIHDREVDDERLFLAVRVDERRLEVRHELHVRLVDRLETADGRAVEHLALFDRVGVEALGRDVEVLHDPGEVAESDVDELDILVLDEFQSLVSGLEH